MKSSIKEMRAEIEMQILRDRNVLFITKAINSHKELLQAIKELIKWVGNCYCDVVTGMKKGEGTKCAVCLARQAVVLAEYK